MKISVLICTRNRAASLRRALESVFAQRLTTDGDYEVVVVDNGSEDETRRVVAEFAALHGGRLLYCYEGRPGLARARNAGLEAATGEVIAFTDDDVLVREDWLDGVRREFEADPDLHLLSGRVLPARAGLQPVALQLSEEPGTYSTPEHATQALGANMAFRREVFARCGPFDTRLGAGTFFAGAEEVEMAYRALRAGHRLRYAPNVTVYHDHDRVTVRQACSLEYGYGKGHVAYLVKHLLGGDRYALRIAYWSLLHLFKRGLRRGGISRDAARLARAHLRGMAAALVPALWRMREPQETYGLTQKYEKRSGVEVGRSVVAARRSRL
jgi:glycosyltransferase involved in cell wall biosynthesis